MRAHLNSRGLGVWEITQDETYVIPPNCVSQEEKDKYFANNKVVDILLSGLCHAEFDRVEDLVLAHKIWSTLQIFHEGREYENFYCTRISHIYSARPPMSSSIALFLL